MLSCCWKTYYLYLLSMANTHRLDLMRLSLTSILFSLNLPLKVPIMWIGRISFLVHWFVAEFRGSDKICTNYVEFARFFITQHKLHKIRVIHAYVGSTACLGEDSLKCADCTNFVSLTDVGGRLHGVCSVHQQFSSFVEFLQKID